jgi:DMSO/TMAO reductase YedYZ heme-binding membrane subunit
MRRRRSREIALSCLVAGVVAVSAAALGVAVGDDRATSWQLAARYTARVAFPLFLTIFVAGPWQRLWPGAPSRWLVAHRRALGLAFATMFSVHLVALTTFAFVRQQAPGLVALTVGGGAFVALYALALTSTDAAVRRLGVRRWRRLHRFGLYYLWLIFTITYVGRQTRSRDLLAVFAAACIAALLLRVVAARRQPRRSPAIATA